MTELLPHPDAPEFDDIRADLARLFIAHKHEMEIGHVPDEYIVEATSEICSLMINIAKLAHANKDYTWLSRHKWFLDATTRMLDGGAATKLDG